MRAIKFRLSGQAAFFKKPEVNSYAYFTYSQIHKVALLGILGSIIGLKGYSAQKDATYPEFYEVLKNLKVAIVPTSQGNVYGVCNKKIQVFNNSVGYASQEEGGNLIVKEQWLEKPSWTVYVLEAQTPYFEKLKHYLLTRRCEYIPYLGKNEHFANIEAVEEIEIATIKEATQIHSLYPATAVVYDEDGFGWGENNYYKYQEKLPIGLEATCNQYEVESFILSNRNINSITPLEEHILGKYEETVLYFF